MADFPAPPFYRRLNRMAGFFKTTQAIQDNGCSFEPPAPTPPPVTGTGNPAPPNYRKLNPMGTYLAAEAALTDCLAWSIVDFSSYDRPVTPNDAEGTTTTFKFGSRAIRQNARGRGPEVPADPLFVFVNNGVTVEGWVYIESGGSAPWTTFAWQYNGVDEGWYFYEQPGGGLWLDIQVGGVWVLSFTNGAEVTRDTWHHVGFRWRDGNIEILLDGVVVGTAPYAGPWPDAGTPLTLGHDDDSGSETIFYQDEWRVSDCNRHGWSASTYLVPTEPFEDDINTLLLFHYDVATPIAEGEVLLLHLDNVADPANVVDYSPIGRVITTSPLAPPGDPNISAWAARFGAGGLLANNGIPLYAAPSNSLLLGSGDWSIEFFVRLPPAGPAIDPEAMFCLGTDAGNFIMFGPIGGTLWGVSCGIDGVPVTGWSGLELDWFYVLAYYPEQFAHVAVYVFNGTAYLALDGQVSTGGPVPQNFSRIEGPLNIGGSLDVLGSGVATHLGIDEVRICKGVIDAKYDGTNFIPPAAPYPPP